MPPPRPARRLDPENNWKLIERFETGKVELNQLSEDPSEKHDLAAEEPEKAASLLDALSRWRKEVGAQMMTPNPDHDPSRKQKHR